MTEDGGKREKGALRCRSHSLAGLERVDKEVDSFYVSPAPTNTKAENW